MLPQMVVKRNSDKSSSRVEIIVVDRRNTEKKETSGHSVYLISKTKESIIFKADWQFPVPASKRRFFLGKRELAVEEYGKVPGRNLFQFSGKF